MNDNNGLPADNDGSVLPGSVSQEWQQVFALSAAKEKEAHELFSHRFDRDFAMPQKVSVALMQTIGWQFIVIIIQNVAAVLLAAMRTADMFFDAAGGSNAALQYIEAGAAILAIEFGAVVYSAIKAEIENRSRDAGTLRASSMTSVRQLWVGITAAVFISMIAGLGTTFKGFGLDVAWFKWALAIVMGLGASVIAAISGDILGVMLARVGNIRDGAQAEYERRVEERTARKLSMWESAPERAIARSELTELKDFLKHARAAAPRKEPAPKPRTSTRGNEIRMKIYNELDLNWGQHHDASQILGPTALQTTLGVSKGYASDVIKAWRAERGIPTPESTA